MPPCQDVFTRSQRLVLGVVPPLAVGLMKSLLWSCKWDVREKGHWDAALAAHGRVIIAIWHESMAMGAYYFRNEGFCTIASQSFDGEIGVRIVNGFGHSAVRGSSSRGGSAALKGLGEVLRKGGTVGFTLDGPRGPRRFAKPGVSILSARTQTYVVPIAFSVQPSHNLKSWDKFPVPMPFANITVLFGPALAPPDSDSAGNVETLRQETEFALNGLHDRI